MLYLLNTFYSLFPHVSYLRGIPQIFYIFLSIYSVVVSGSDAANLLMMTLMLEDMLLFLKLNFFYVVQEMYWGFLGFFVCLFVCLWLCWVFVSVRGLSLVVASGGHSSSWCAGLSLSWPLLLRSTGSRRAGSVIVAHGPSCSAACGIFPDQGSNPWSPALAGRFSTTAPPGKPKCTVFKASLNWDFLLFTAEYSVIFSQ